MRLMVHRTSRAILAASNVGNWQVPDFGEIVDVPGDAETFIWPNGGASRSRVAADNQTIEADPAWTPPPPSRLAQALDTLLGSPNPTPLQITAVLRIWRQILL